MSKKEEPVLGLWISEERVPDYIKRGYVITNPQPSVAQDMKRFRAGHVHMIRKVA